MAWLEKPWFEIAWLEMAWIEVPCFEKPGERLVAVSLAGHEHRGGLGLLALAKNVKDAGNGPAGGYHSNSHCRKHGQEKNKY
jgi:hypothetical protein